MKINDCAVEAAMQTTVTANVPWRDVYPGDVDDLNAVFEDMRAALAAALPKILGDLHWLRPVLENELGFQRLRLQHIGRGPESKVLQAEAVEALRGGHCVDRRFGGDLVNGFDQIALEIAQRFAMDHEPRLAVMQRAIANALKAAARQAEPAWQLQLADALDCAWNPAVQQDRDGNGPGAVVAMALAAVANRLRELAPTEAPSDG